MCSTLAVESVRDEAPDLAQVVERVRHGVLLVETEDGHASGFLFDSGGLIQTSGGLYAAHFEQSTLSGAMRAYAYDPSSHIRVVLAADRKVRARLVRYDESSGTAIVRIHPDLVDGLRVLAPVVEPPEKRDTLFALCPRPDGVAMAAIASVWKRRRKNDTNFFVDVDLERGDLGCPLFDLAGDVAGTYHGQAYGDLGGSKRERSRLILASEITQSLREAARADLADTAPPSPELLPTVPERPYPRSLAESLAGEIDVDDYVERTQSLSLEFLTPPLLRRLEQADATGSRTPTGQAVEYSPAEGFFDWRRQDRSEDAVVTIRVMGKITKVRNDPATFLGGLNMLFNPSDRSFESDFVRLELVRDGETIEPIDPRRICGRFSVRALTSSGETDWKDALYGCYGSYTYRPEVFDTEAPFILRIRDSAHAEPSEHPVPPRTLARIRADFRSYLVPAD